MLNPKAEPWVLPTAASDTSVAIVTTEAGEAEPIKEKIKPDFNVSGKLAEETNLVNGVLLKYTEPAEARKPKLRWRLYPFKKEDSLPIIYIHRQSSYLMGRDHKVGVR